jgi:hypothetical protein
MDGQSFDRVARALGAGMTRRSGVLGLLGAALGGSVAAGNEANHGKDRGKGRPTVSAPCGKGKKANVCTKDSDCCTNICKTNLKTKDGKGRCRCLSKGGRCTEDRNCCGGYTCVNRQCGGSVPLVVTGRPCDPAKDACRDTDATCTAYASGSPAGTYCLKPSEAICSADSQCANQDCRANVCGGKLIASGTACDPVKDTCRDTDATCVAYTSGDPAGTYCLKPATAICSSDEQCANQDCRESACGGKQIETGNACDAAKDTCRDPNASCVEYRYQTPAGTYCLMPTMGLCAAGGDCVSGRCRQGTCRPCSTAACAQDCTPSVCATCTYTTVQAAIDAASDGDVIDIGAGTWIENLTVSKDLTLRSCPGQRVILRNASYGFRTIEVSSGKSLTLLDVIVDGYHNRTGGSSGGGISSSGDVTLAGTSVIKNAGWKMRGAGIRLVADGKTLTVTDEAEIHDTEGDSYGGAIYVQGNSEMEISGWAQIVDNYSDSYGSGVHCFGGVNVTISDHVRITGNRGQWGGQGVTVANFTATRPTTVTIKDDVVIADNLSFGQNTDGCGLLVYGNSAGPVTALVTDRVLIAGNRAPLSNTGGGGVMVARFVTATISGDVEISGNSAPNGAGVMAYWKPNDRPANWINLTITDSVKITDNTATAMGGGVASFGSTVEITGSVAVFGNRAPKGGGGAVMYVGGASAHSGAMAVTGSATMTGNTATDSAPSGGGIWSDNNANTLDVSGTVSGNSPDQCAGGTITC